jgi:hypothetical protein
VANGRQLGEENLRTFLAWVASKGDSDFRAMASRGVISRKEIATECGFAKSALDQNPRIKAALANLEAGLRERGVLPRIAPEGPESLQAARSPDGRISSRAAVDAERLRRLEQENASLRAECAELKQQLERFKVIRDAMLATGRVPR